MNLEKSKIESGEILPVKAEKEASEEAQVEKEPKVIEREMMENSKKEVGSFKNESKTSLEEVQKKAAEDSLQIDEEDKKELEGLNQEAESAGEELGAEISGKKEQASKEEFSSPFSKKYEGPLPPPPPLISPTSKKFEGWTPPISKTNKEWDPNSGFPPPIPKEYITTPPPLPNEVIKKVEKTKLCAKCGAEIISNAKFCTECGNKIEMPKPKEIIKKESAMKERTIQNPKLLSKKEASKKLLAEERKKLAEEILTERKKNRGEIGDGRYGVLAEMQSNEANAMAERFSSNKKLSEQNAQEERGNLKQLIDNSEGLHEIRKKIEEHYTKADEIAKNKFESIQKTVEQTMIRNNAFIVHAFLLDERLRHNENSNISQRATLEDDIDILLSLEPSISTSSVVPGSRQGLWGGRIGVVLGGGDIKGIVQTDNGTVTGGIKMRDGKISSSKEIDEKVSDKGERGYNELVVNNPEVFGFFQNVQIDKSGNMIGFEKTSSEQDNKNRKEDFLRYIDLAIQKGMPPLIMTPDRRLFEFSSISNEGIVSVGAEITPEKVAKGKAGLPNEKRTEIGEQIITKNLFRKIKDQKEAKEIVAELSGKEKSGVELSQEEYLAYARDNQGGFHNFPKHLLENKNFMLKAAQFNPVSAYEYAGEILKKDMEFIKHIYSLEKKSVANSIYSLMPDELKKNEGVASLAIENNDFENIDSTLADSPAVWEKIVDKKIEQINPNKWFSGNIGEQRYLDLYFSLKKGFSSVDMTEKLITNPNFIQKLDNKYPDYKFEIDEYKRLLITKMA